MKWLYFPFKDISQDPTMPLNQARYQQKYGDGLTVRQFGNVLDDVGDNDMFIIAGHGLPGNENIGVTVEKAGFFEWFSPPKEERMTANTLAEMLKMSGLPLTHKYFKTLTCGGGGMGTVDNGKMKVDVTKTTVDEYILQTPLKALSAENCFASVLAQALARRGYGSVLVKGYPGFVDAREQVKKVTMESGTNEGFSYKYWKDGKAMMVRVTTKSLEEKYWYNGQGWRVIPEGSVIYL